MIKRGDRRYSLDNNPAGEDTMYNSMEMEDQRQSVFVKLIKSDGISWYL